MGPSSAAGLQPENPKCGRVEEWERLDQRAIDNTVKQWRRRLRSCVAAKGGHFQANVVMCQCDSIFSIAWQL